MSTGSFLAAGAWVMRTVGVQMLTRGGYPFGMSSQKAKRLFAVPLIGTASGVKYLHKGKMAREIRATLEAEVPAHDVDFVVEAFVPELPVEALDEGILRRFARCDVCNCTRCFADHASIARLVSSVPLSITIVFGGPRSSAIRSRTRVTRDPLIEVSTSIAKASAEFVYERLSTLPPSQQNITQWAKRQLCWEEIKKLPVLLTAGFRDTLVLENESRSGQRAAKALQQLDAGIDFQSAVLTLGFAYWLTLNKWSEERRALAASDQRAIRMAAGLAAGLPTDKQSKRLLELKKRFEDEGFIFSLAAAEAS